MKRNNKKGFTLAELLIVVAIIAVLVAIAIPVFTGATNKAEVAKDIANVRSYVAEQTVTQLIDDDMEGTISISKAAITGLCDKGHITISGHVVTAEAGSAEQTYTIDSDITLTD
ncbi:MAG: type II secretion system GspH family protein [Oscillospiraceae bacterium]|nr:type II secretion system GspH family protein [Oscillospiraceae bacterium]